MCGDNRLERQLMNGRRTLATTLAGAMIIVAAATPVHAALTREACLAKKATAWGAFRKCQAGQKAKAVLANPDKPTPTNPHPCKTALLGKIFSLTAQAERAAIACRYQVNGDGTVTDFDTALQWEQKTEDGSIHDKSALFTWAASTSHLSTADGTLFTTFLPTLNSCVDDGNTPPGTVKGGFAGHCDWRLPSVVELAAIVDTTIPGCASGAACIDETVFGPTQAFVYVTGTTFGFSPTFQWYVNFADGSEDKTGKNFGLYVRAVRSGL